MVHCISSFDKEIIIIIFCLGTKTMALHHFIEGGCKKTHWLFLSFGLGCLSAIDMVEFNPAIGTKEEVTRTAMNTMELIKILLGKKSHLKEAPLPPVDENKVDNGVTN